MPIWVLHVLNIYQPEYTGEGIFLGRCAAYMQNLAPNVVHEVLVCRTVRPSSPPLPTRGIEAVHYILRRSQTPFRRHMTLWRWLVRNMGGYDVIHLHTHVDRYFISYALARIIGKRLILSATLDDSIPVLVGKYRPLFRPAIRQLFRMFDCFVSVGPKLHNETTSYLPRNPAAMIPCGVAIPPLDSDNRTRIRTTLQISSDDLVLIFVGGKQSRKDPLFLIQNFPPIISR